MPIMQVDPDGTVLETGEEWGRGNDTLLHVRKLRIFQAVVIHENVLIGDGRWFLEKDTMASKGLQITLDELKPLFGIPSLGRREACFAGRQLLAIPIDLIPWDQTPTDEVLQFRGITGLSTHALVKEMCCVKDGVVTSFNDSDVDLNRPWVPNVALLHAIFSFFPTPSSIRDTMEELVSNKDHLWFVSTIFNRIVLNM